MNTRSWLSSIAALVSLMVIVLANTAPALSDTLCLRSTITKKGKIKNSTKTVAGNLKCPRGFIALFSAQQLTSLGGDGSVGIQGPAGPQGEQGLTGPQGPTGSQGPQGPQGAQGNQGDPGPAGVDGLFIVSGQSATDSTSPKSAFAECPLGSQVLGGFGGAFDGIGIPFNGPVAISFSSVVPFSRFHSVRAYETTATAANWYVLAFALCRPSP